METEIKLLKKQIKRMRTSMYIMYAVLAGTLTAILFMATGSKELNVERINIREADGTLKMVLSNKKRQHPGRMLGKDLPAREREAGMIFFNSDGDECGGLVYDNDKKSAGMVYSVDKYHDDQVMQLQYQEDTQTKERKYGLQLWSYSKEASYLEREAKFKELTKLKSRDAALKELRDQGLASSDRLFVGMTYQKEVGLFIKDDKGRARIRIYVDESNKAAIETLDTTGRVVSVN